MKLLGARFKSVSVACGIAFLVTVSSPAQESPPPTPRTAVPKATPDSHTASPSPAQTGGTKSKPTTATRPNQFTTMDANKDGRISATEYRNTSMAAFLLMDKDRDGKVSAVELTEAQPAASGAPSPFSSDQMSEVDANKDSQLTSTEASDGAARMFKNLDINHNEFLSAKELYGGKHRSNTAASADTRKNSAKDVPASKESAH